MSWVDTDYYEHVWGNTFKWTADELDYTCPKCGAEPGFPCVYTWGVDATEYTRKVSTSKSAVKIRKRVGHPVEKLHRERPHSYKWDTMTSMRRDPDTWAPVIEMFQEMDE